MSSLAIRGSAKSAKSSQLKALHLRKIAMQAPLVYADGPISLLKFNLKLGIISTILF